MIFIQRPNAEPPELAKQRRAGLKRAFSALNTYGPDSKELKEALERYDGGKEKLFKAQHRKCAYCERRTGFKGSPVDHFRPRREAWRHPPGSPDIIEAGYW